MNKRLKSRILAAAAALALVPALTPGARAQAVYCTNCSSEVTQLLNLARLIDQLGTQQNILTTGTNQFQTMTVNTTPYASLSWSNGVANLASVNSLLSSPSLLGLGTSQYGTYNSYLSTQPTSSGVRRQISAVVLGHQFERAHRAPGGPAAGKPDHRRRAGNLE